MVIASTYASNVGQLIINLTGRGYLVKLQSEKNLFNNDVLYMQVVNIKHGASVKHALTEAEVTAIQDISIIADAIAERVRKS